MPNWCSNDLFIYGKDLQAIADKVRAEVDGKVSLFTFDNICQCLRCCETPKPVATRG